MLEKFWPGPLTLIVYKSNFVPDIFTSGSNTVAVRVSSHPVAIKLVEGLGVPISGTSANISGQPSLKMYKEVKQQLGNLVDIIINGDKCPGGGVESTIVDVTRDIPLIIREGSISRDSILAVCDVT